MSIEFLITTLVVVASPGTGVLYTLAAGLTRGAKMLELSAVFMVVAFVVFAIYGVCAAGCGNT